MDNYTLAAIFTFVRCGGITTSWGWDHSEQQSSTRPHNIPAYFSTYFPQGWPAHLPTRMGLSTLPTTPMTTTTYLSILNLSSTFTMTTVDTSRTV